jgi:hypothetical protein
MPCRVTFASAVLLEISGIVVKMILYNIELPGAGELEGCLRLRQNYTDVDIDQG